MSGTTAGFTIQVKDLRDVDALVALHVLRYRITGCHEGADGQMIVTSIAAPRETGVPQPAMPITEAVEFRLTQKASKGIPLLCESRTAAVCQVLPKFDSWALEKQPGSTLFGATLLIEHNDYDEPVRQEAHDEQLGLAICLAALQTRGISLVFAETPAVPDNG